MFERLEERLLIYVFEPILVLREAQNEKGMGIKMIQDIYPKAYHVEYESKEPDAVDRVIHFLDGKVFIRQREEEQRFPVFADIKNAECSYIYLFAIDTTGYFLSVTEERITLKDYDYEPIENFRDIKPKHIGFVMVTAFQLFSWYKDNRYCGRCGELLVHDDQERMLHCEECNNVVYPGISPAVIVAVTNGDKILMTKYAGREYNRYALIAGFAEVGESLEQTVVREVMEEVGLKIKNIRYYKSQPWAFSGTLLAGFFAELDGSDCITLDKKELSAADWFQRDEIPVKDDGVSLTREMIRVFKEE